MDQLLTVVGIKSKSNWHQKNENLLAFAWKNCLLFTYNLKESLLWSRTKQMEGKKRFNWIPVGLSLLVGCQCMSDKTNLDKQSTSASDKKMLFISLGHLVTEGTQWEGWHQLTMHPWVVKSTDVNNVSWWLVDGSWCLLRKSVLAENLDLQQCCQLIFIPFQSFVDWQCWNQLRN